MLKSLALLTAILFAAQALADPRTPLLQYTPEQVSACAPLLRTDSAAASKKSYTGEPVTARAKSSITATDGRFLDFRDDAYAYHTDGQNLRRAGKPEVTTRINQIYPKTVELVTVSHRGRSLRFGRNARANNMLAIYEVNGTLECLQALGYLSF